MLKHLTAGNNRGCGGKNALEPAQYTQNETGSALAWSLIFPVSIVRQLSFFGHFHSYIFSSTVTGALLPSSQVFFEYHDEIFFNCRIHKLYFLVLFAVKNILHGYPQLRGDILCCFA